MTTKKAKRYAITEVFHTLQGEGVHAGRAAVFVRFAGCNLWSGKDADRLRDRDRNRAACPEWCDTDFLVRERLTAIELANRINEQWGALNQHVPFVVFTGGEPGLQLDWPLMDAIRSVCNGAEFAIETNGTIDLSGLESERNHFSWQRPHVCVSPKVTPDRMKLKRADEVKLVYPAHSPLVWWTGLEGHAFAKHWWIQPLDQTVPIASLRKSDRMHTLTATFGKIDAVNAEVMRHCVEFVKEHPQFRLSIQAHKVIGIP